jgi:MSHA biogenesis protein MshK|tara:strand:- start:611 stop:967 length:357 start_codon:yes stop_codon:yes gene_type:complete
VFKIAFSLNLLLLAFTVAKTSSAAELDPTKPFEYSGAIIGQENSNNGFVLSSIVHGDGIHTAVINKNIYQLFDYIGEYKITAINSDSVILRNKSERLKLNIFKHTGFKSKVIKNMVVN